MYFIFVIIIILIILLLAFVIYFDLIRVYKLNRYCLEDLYKLDHDYNKKERVRIKGNVVISFTTIPDRINKIIPTLCSILDQSQRVDEIRINLPYKSMRGIKYHVPKWLYNLKNIKVARVKNDLGPSTKLLPTVKDEYTKNNAYTNNKYNTKIIVIDDDHIYGSYFVESLVESFKDHDGECAITNYGSDIDVGSIGRGLQYSRGGRWVDILFGCGGYILTPAMLPQQVHDYTLGPDEAKYVDDNWISGWLSLNKVKIWCKGMQKGSTFFPNKSTIGTTALKDTFNRDGKNWRTVNQWFIEQGAFSD